MTSSPSTNSSSSSSTPHGGKYWFHDKRGTHADGSTRSIDASKIEAHLLFFCFSGHCKKLAPEYEAAAEVLSKNDPPIALAKVDATQEKTLAERFGIQGFPTLMWFK